VGGVKEAINSSLAKKIYICNVAQERGETENFTVEDHIEELLKIGLNLDYCLVNNKIIKKTEDVSQLGAIQNITTSKTQFKGVRILKMNLIDTKNPLYHNPEKLAQAVLNLIKTA